MPLNGRLKNGEDDKFHSFILPHLKKSFKFYK